MTYVIRCRNSTFRIQIRKDNANNCPEFVLQLHAIVPQRADYVPSDSPAMTNCYVFLKDNALMERDLTFDDIKP